MIREEKIAILREAAGLLNTAIAPYTLSETGIKGLTATMKRFDYNLSLFKDALAAGASYLKQVDGVITQDSANTLINKYGGIMFNMQSQQQDPEMHELVKYLNSKMSFAKPWVKSKVINEMKAMKKAGISMETLYKVALKNNKWIDLVDGLADVVVEVEVLSENR